MLLDTSGLLCYLDVTDPRHLDADAYFLLATRRVTHSYVLAELIPLCESRGLDCSRVLVFAEDLAKDAQTEIVWVDPVLHQLALSLLRMRLDKTYSLCDAVSFVLMRQRGFTEALTTDRHFSQEGFQRLLPP